jgi:DNA (cytosine-5)-methyltransferase 1
MKYLSVCSGIEAATVAWHPLGWQPVAFSEIEPFPSAVLAHHYPSVPNLGDMTKFQEWHRAYQEPDKRPAPEVEPVHEVSDSDSGLRADAQGAEESLRSVRVPDGAPSSGSRSCDRAGSRDFVPPVQHKTSVGRGQRLDDVGVRLPVRPQIDFADVDLLVGGTPCQAFSVAGKRESLADARGNLSLTYIKLLEAIDEQRSRAGRPPAICIWENVPGVLSTKDNAFGCFLAGLVGEEVPLQAPRGKWKDAGVVVGPERLAAWRILDAQFFGVAQRRRRVFLVSVSLRHPRAWACAAAVLPLIESVQRNPAPSREARQGAAASVGGGVNERGTGVAPHIFKVRGGVEREDGSRGSTNIGKQAGKGYLGSEERAFTLAAAQDQFVAQPVATAMQVRRLTPVECERLQGFPDGYTNIPWRKSPEAPDGPRYKALGNSMAVPCMAWIGKRIAEVDNDPLA